MRQPTEVENYARRESAAWGIRWASNMLVELLSQHGEAIGDVPRIAVRNAIRELAEAESDLRKSRSSNQK